MKTLICWVCLLATTVVFGAGHPGEPSNDREALALAAVESLVAAPESRALPLLRKVLQGNQTTLVKRRALFVLGQIGAPEGRDILLDYAKSADENLQSEAIRAIAISGHTEGLKDLYGSASTGVRREIIRAYLIADDAESVFSIAQAADSPEEYDEAVRTLGAMGATEYLRQLGTPTSGVLQAYSIAGDLEGLLEVALGSSREYDDRLRVEATRMLGVVGGERAAEALESIYREQSGTPQAQAALEGLFIADADQRLLRLYRETTDLQRKTELLRMLSTMGSDAVLEAVDSALEAGMPE